MRKAEETHLPKILKVQDTWVSVYKWGSGLRGFASQELQLFGGLGLDLTKRDHLLMGTSV